MLLVPFLLSLGQLVQSTPVISPRAQADDQLVSRRLLAHQPAKRSLLDQQRKTVNLTLLHVNDVHAHLDQYQPLGTDCPPDGSKPCLGGYARIIKEVGRVRESNGQVPVLLLNAGDEFQGTLFYSYYGPSKIAETLNLLDFDAFTLGNHEFDGGPDPLASFLANLSAPCISTNVFTTHPTLREHIQPYLILPEHELAIVALTTVDTPDISQPGEETHFGDVRGVQATVDGLLEGSLGGLGEDGKPKVKRVIALTHIGYEQDLLLARSTRNLHLIVGGHSHTPLGGDPSYSVGPYPTIATNLDGDEVFVVTSYRWGEHLGKIDLAFDPHSGKVDAYTGGVVRLTEEFARDEVYQKKVDGWRKPFDRFAKTVVGQTEFDLEQANCQDEECTMGDFVADAFLWARQSIGADVDGCIHNSGGIRNGVSRPNITQGSLATAFPFGNELVDIRLTGSDLWSVFEGVASGVNLRGKTVTSTVQIAGMEYEFNPNNKKGSRLISLRIGSPLAEVEMDREYKIVTLDFVATGGDSILFDPLKVAPPGVASEIDSITAYVKAFSPISVEVDGRIRRTNETVPRKPAGEAMWPMTESEGRGQVQLAPDGSALGWGGWREWVREQERRTGRWY